MLIGYSRVSTLPQDIDAQREALSALGVPTADQVLDHGFTGKTMTRDGIQRVMTMARLGDKVIVPRLDRLARNTEDALKILRELTDRGVVMQIGLTVYDPKDVMAKLFFTMLAAVAEAEGGWISIRTKEAMARPSVRAKLRGRRPVLTPKKDAQIYRHWQDPHMSIGEIADLFNTSRTGVYRAIARHKATLTVVDSTNV